MSLLYLTKHIVTEHPRLDCIMDVTSGVYKGADGPRFITLVKVFANLSGRRDAKPIWFGNLQSLLAQHFPDHCDLWRLHGQLYTGTEEQRQATKKYQLRLVVLDKA